MPRAVNSLLPDADDRTNLRRMSGENLDISTDGFVLHGDAAESARQRPYIGIHFACCGVYARIAINKRKTAYSGHCPRCLKRIEIKIGPGGTDSRFFTAY